MWAPICCKCIRTCSQQNAMLSCMPHTSKQLVSTALEFWTCNFQANAIFIFIAQWLWKSTVIITAHWKNVVKSMMVLVWLQNQFVCHCCHDEVSTSKVIKNNRWYNYLLLSFLIISTLSGNLNWRTGHCTATQSMSFSSQIICEHNTKIALLSKPSCFCFMDILHAMK